MDYNPERSPENTWRHLVHERFLPSLWRPALLRDQPPNDEVFRLIDGECRRGPVPGA